MRLIRPLLGFTRQEILDYSQRAGVEFRQDPSNSDPAFRRNFLRHELLPRIRETINPRVDEALLRLGTFAASAEDALTQAGKKLLRRAKIKKSKTQRILSAGKLAAAPQAIRTTALRLALQQLNAPQRDLTAEHLSTLDALLAGGQTGTLNLPGNFTARRAGETLHLRAPRA